MKTINATTDKICHDGEGAPDDALICLFPWFIRARDLYDLRQGKIHVLPEVYLPVKKCMNNVYFEAIEPQKAYYLTKLILMIEKEKSPFNSAYSLDNGGKKLSAKLDFVGMTPLQEIVFKHFEEGI